MRGLRGLYVVVGLIMAGTGAVFVLLAELEHRYGLPTGSLGLIAGSAFAAALVTQLGLARYADRGYARCSCCAPVWRWRGRAAVVRRGHRAVAVRRRPGDAGRQRRDDHPAGPAGDRARLDGNLGERLGVFYAAYLAGLRVRPADRRRARP